MKVVDKKTNNTYSSSITGNDLYDGNSYGWDLAGNPKSRVENAITTTYTLGVGNKLLSWTDGSYQYNAAGCITNITHGNDTLALAWNSQYQLTSVSTNGVVAESYQYDAYGRRTCSVRSQNGITNYYIYDGNQVIADVDASGNLLRSYTWRSGIDNMLAMTVYTGSVVKIYYALTDHLGTVHALTDSTGNIVESYKYDAWGRVLSVEDANGNQLTESTIGNRYLWQGREYSRTTHLYYFRARWYDPITGRWLSKDPIGISGGLNQYVFVENNPVMYMDPFGLWQVTIGGAYGIGGRITFGRNQGRWNIGGAFGYGIGIMIRGTLENVDPSYASGGLSSKVGVEVSGGVKVGGIDVRGGLRAQTEADECNKIETRSGAIGSVRIPGSTVNVGGSADVVIRGNLNCGTASIFGDVQRDPVEVGLGGMIFGGVTVGVSW